MNVISSIMKLSPVLIPLRNFFILLLLLSPIGSFFGFKIPDLVPGWIADLIIQEPYVEYRVKNDMRKEEDAPTDYVRLEDVFEYSKGCLFGGFCPKKVMNDTTLTVSIVYVFITMSAAVLNGILGTISLYRLVRFRGIDQGIWRMILGSFSFGAFVTNIKSGSNVLLALICATFWCLFSDAMEKSTEQLNINEVEVVNGETYTVYAVLLLVFTILPFVGKLFSLLRHRFYLPRATS